MTSIKTTECNENTLSLLWIIIKRNNIPKCSIKYFFLSLLTSSFDHQWAMLEPMAKGKISNTDPVLIYNFDILFIMNSFELNFLKYWIKLLFILIIESFDTSLNFGPEANTSVTSSYFLSWCPQVLSEEK